MNWSSKWQQLEAGATLPVEDLTDHDFLIQLWYQARARAWPLSACKNWPTGDREWHTFKITGVSASGGIITLTGDPSPSESFLGAANFIDESQSNLKRWVSWPGGGGMTFNGTGVASFAPASYDIVADVDNYDYWKVLSGQIIDTPTDTTITTYDDGNWRLNGNLSDLIGTRAAIYERGARCWADRWPEKPVRIQHVLSPAAFTPSYIDVEDDGFGDLAGRELIGVFAAQIRRVAITSTAPAAPGFIRISFANQGATPSGTFYVIAAGAYWQSRRATATPTAGFEPGRMFEWYRGQKRSTYTHQSNDVLALQPMLAEGGTNVTGDNVAIIDRDVIFLEEADNLDLIVNPDMPKSLRGLCAYVEQLLEGYILQWSVDEGGDSAAHMTLGNVAQAMAAIGGNYVTRGISATGGGLATFSGSITMPDDAPEQKAFVVKYGANGRYLSHGMGLVTETTVEEGAVGGLTPGVETVGISFGLPNPFQRRVQNIYGRTYFVPEVEYDDFGVAIGVYDPPTEEHPGEYVDVPPDTACAEYFDALYPSSGVVCGQLVANAGREFATGMRLRYVGHNEPDPTTFVTSSDVGTAEYLLRGYRDYRCVRNSPPASQTALRGEQWLMPTTSGTITSANAWSFTDSAARFEVSDTPRYTVYGTGNGSSSAAILEDTTKSSNGFFTSMGGERFTGMVVQVEISAGVWEKYLIESHATTTITPAYVNFSTTTNGKAFKIEAPAGASGTSGPGIGRYLRRHKIIITDHTNGEEHEIVVAGHDNKTILFDPIDYVPQVGDTWRVEWIRVGDTVEWTADDAFQNFPDDVFNGIQPDTVEQYGRLAKSSFWAANNGALLVQLKKLIDLMRYTGTRPSWQLNGEDNGKREDAISGSYADLKAQVASEWPTQGAIGWVGDGWYGTSPDGIGRVPMSITRVGYVAVIEDQNVGALQQYAYLEFAPVQCERFGFASRKVEVWGYITFNYADDDLGTISLNPGPNNFFGIRELADAPLTPSGATLQFRKWTKCYSEESSDPTLLIRIGDETLPQPAWPTSNPTVEHIPPDPPPDVVGETVVCDRWCYVKEHFAVVDWQPFFDSLPSPG